MVQEYAGGEFVMSIEKWPCIPDNFSSILPGELPSFLQVGVTHGIKRAVSIIDPKNRKRFDAFNRFDGFQPFCRCLRGECINQIGNINWDDRCTECDIRVAKRLVSDFNTSLYTPLTPVKYRCYMGLEEVATLIYVSGLPVMVVSGQFRPPEGINDVKVSISCLGKRSPQEQEISPTMWESLRRHNLTEELWVGSMPSPETRGQLIELAEELIPISDGYEDKLIHEAQRIQEIAQSYSDMAKAKVEARIIQQVASSFNQAALYSDEPGFWSSVGESLNIMKEAFDLEYVAFLSGQTETDTLLKLKSISASPPKSIPQDHSFHFNWKKAGIKSNDGQDLSSQLIDWSSYSIVDSAHLSRGFKIIPDPFPSFEALVPVKLSRGPYGLLVLGRQRAGVKLVDHEKFVLSASHDLATRILTIQLSLILNNDRTNWERAAKLTGHRLRSSIQNINSQLKTIRSASLGLLDFSENERMAAENDLEKSFRELEEISFAAESSVPGALDVKSARRETISLGDIIDSAVDDQQSVAEQAGVKIITSGKLYTLPKIFGNFTLLKFAFINLINNGLKYSYPKLENRERELNIHPAREIPDPGKVFIEIVNFGLGIKEEDQNRIFEWGVRIVGAKPPFKEVYGKGIGLWEVKRIVEGHGGQVKVNSVHYTKGPITDMNIRQCITVFTVVLFSEERVFD